MAKKHERPRRPIVSDDALLRPRPRPSYDLSKPSRPAPAETPAPPETATTEPPTVSPLAKKTASKPARSAPAKPSKAKGAPPRQAKPRKIAVPAKTRPPSKASAAPPKPAPKALPSKLAAFSEKVLEEEEEPVAVRSWSEAKQGIQASAEFVPKTGEVNPVEGEEEAEDSDDVEEVPRAKSEPRMEPLTGQFAVPQDRREEFQFVKPAAARKGKRGENPEDFGQVELRQATASGGRHLTTAKPENLERGAERIRPLTSGEGQGLSAPKQAAPSREKMKMAPPQAAGSGPDLTDFGEVHIAQQTRSGARKVGTLEPSDDEQAGEKRKRPK